MKVSTIFFIIIIALAIIYSSLVALGKSGFKFEKLSANMSSFLNSQKSPINVSPKSIDTPTAPKSKGNNKTTTPSPIINKVEDKIKLSIYGVSFQSYYHPSLITLNYKSGSEKTDITGWKIKTRQGEFVISQAMEKYNTFMSESDINISKYETVYLISGKSPLGKNFKSNQCLGYLSQTADFYPSIWSYCPSKTKTEGFFGLSPFCQDFISNSYGCQTPNYSQNLTIAMDSACVAYINQHYCYSGCFTDNSNTKDFLESSWYVYTETNLVNPLHDTIYLYDETNTLISQYSY